MSNPYFKAQRLADVMALIQVLALDRHAHRSLDGVTRELPDGPRSAPCWKTVATEHPEFFRVGVGNHPLSLVSRHVQPRDEDGERVPLPADYVGTLLQSAIELHDREMERKYEWKVYSPLVVVVTAGIFTLIGSCIG